MLILIEFCLSLLIVPLAFVIPGAGRHFFGAIERHVSGFAAHRRLAVMTIFLLAIAARLAVLPVEPVPAPGIHDEFGYLLSADTFAHGRLTNPTHPMWVHFESMTIIQQPTYCSAFYPAQGMFLAIGQVLFRHPFWGVLFSTALMCAAICWALQGWMPPGWAFLGGVLAIMRLATFNYWANSYWGGAVAAIGGALALGALPRIRRHRRVSDSILLAAGLAILANSRPYEGLFYSLSIVIALAVFVFGKNAPANSFRNVVLPISGAMALCFAFMAYYFWRTTGNPLRPPYLIDVATYMQEPQFLWGKLRTAPAYHHAVMAQFYGGFHLQIFRDAQNEPLISALRRFLNFWMFYIGPALTLPFFVLAGVLPYGVSLRDLGGKTLFLVALTSVAFFALLLPVPYLPHYAAPMTCAVFALFLQAMRRVRIWDRHGRGKGAFVVRAIVLNCVIIFLAIGFGLASGIPRAKCFPYEMIRPNSARAQLIENLHKQGGKYLIIVHYQPGHDGNDEWVYNNADIDGSNIVWAREMTSAEDQQLVAYFKDRQVWLLDADAKPPKLEKYVAQTEPIHDRTSDIVMWRSPASADN